MTGTTVEVELMASGGRSRGARVLVVEDVADVAEMIRYDLGGPCAPCSSATMSSPRRSSTATGRS